MSAADVALKPCPFCGGEARWVEDHGRLMEPFGLIVQHKPDCWLSDYLLAFDRETLTSAWSTRAVLQETPDAQ